MNKVRCETTDLYIGFIQTYDWFKRFKNEQISTQDDLVKVRATIDKDHRRTNTMFVTFVTYHMALTEHSL